MNNQSRGGWRSIRTVLIYGPDYQKLTPFSRLTFLTLKLALGPSGIDTVAGLVPALAEQTGMSEITVGDALEELVVTGWIKRERNVIWIIEGLKHEPAFAVSNLRHRLAVENHTKALPRLQVVQDFIAYYPEWFMGQPPLPAPEPLKKLTTKPKVPAKPKPVVANSWVAEGCEWWKENVGTTSFPRFGAALKDLVDKHGWERVFTALQGYVKQGHDTGKTIKPEWFAAEAMRWLDPSVVQRNKNARLTKVEQDEEDRKMASDKAVIEYVRTYKNFHAEGEQWWDTMKAEAKAQDRYAIAYAREWIQKHGAP